MMRGWMGLAAAMAWLALQAAALAQQQPQQGPDRRAAGAPVRITPPQATPAQAATARPAPAARQAEPAPRKPGAGPAQPASPAGSRPAQEKTRPVPTPQSAGFGRVPIDNFSFGLEFDRKLKPDQFPDGRRLPGLESHRRDNQSPFIGLSVSVPTN